MESNTVLVRKGLQTRGKFLVVLLPLIVVSLAVMVFLTIRYVKASTRTALRESLGETAVIAASRVADRANSDISLAESIASRIGALYSDQITEPYDAAEATAFEAQMVALGENYGFMHMYVIDADGFARTSKHSNVGENAPDYYPLIMAGASHCTTDPVLDTGKFIGMYKLNVVVPIYDGDGKYIGMLVCMVNAMELNDLVADIRVGKAGSTFIMDSNGRTIAHQDPEMLFDGEKYLAMKDNPEYPSLNKLWADMEAKGQGYASYDYNGPRLAAYTTIANTSNWVLAVTVSEDEFMQQTETAILISVVVALVLTLICSAVIISFLDHISRRIGSVSTRLEAIAGGDLSSPQLPVQTTDEIGALEAASNRLNTDLHTVISRIDAGLCEMSSGDLTMVEREPMAGDFAAIDLAILDNKRKLGEMIRDIARTAEEVSRGSAQMAGGASSLAQGASEQASSVEELFTSVSEVSQKARALGGAAVAYGLPDEEDEDELLDTRLGDADTMVEKLRISMSRIGGAAKSVRRLALDIDTLASETGMLALNASVEATHAGEYGRGFAVIAAEIRALSEKSRAAARAADKMIDSIQRAIDRGEQTVGYTVESVDEMVLSIGQFKNALEQISNVIESTAATAEETAASSEELSTQAELLKEMIAGFTCDTNETEGWGQENE